MSIALKRPPFSTGVSFLDEILGGGQYSGATHGVVMPTGHGKSHMAMMIAMGSALAARHSGGERRWLIVSDHMSVDDLSINLLSFAAQIPRGSVISKYRSECEEGKKVRSLVQFINRTVSVIDEAVWTEMRQKGRKGFNPWCFADERISRYAESGGLAGIVLDDTSKMSLLPVLRNDGSEVWPHEVLLDVASHWAPRWAKDYDCPVWLMHSTNGNATEAEPLAELSVKNALHCKGFGAALDVCIVGGTRERNTLSEVSLIQCCRNKFRSAREQVSRRVPIKIDPEIAAIVEAVDFFEDPDRGTLVQRACSESISNASNLDHLEAIKRGLRDGKSESGIQQEQDSRD